MAFWTWQKRRKEKFPPARVDKVYPHENFDHAVHSDLECTRHFCFLSEFLSLYENLENYVLLTNFLCHRRL